MIIQRETHIKSPKKISRHEVKQKPKKLIVKQKKIKVEPTNPRAIVTLKGNYTGTLVADYIITEATMV